MNTRPLSAALALVLPFGNLACSGAPLDEHTATGAEPVGMAISTDRAAETTATVEVWGTVERMDPEAPSRSPVHVAGAEVCLVSVLGERCTTTDDRGQYTLVAGASAEQAELRVAHPDYRTTKSRVSLAADASHALGVVPNVTPLADGAVLVRGFMSAYFALTPLPGLSLEVANDSDSTTATANAEGFAWVPTSDGSVRISGAEAAMSCGAWDGSHVALGAATVSVEAGTVTEVDVVCGPDQREL